MTLLLAKKCSDGVLLVADSIRVVQNPGPPATTVYTEGDSKIISGTRNGSPYCLIFGGYAQIDSLKHVSEWLTDAAKRPGQLKENVADALKEAIDDARRKGNWASPEERLEWELHGASSVVLLSEKPYELWVVIVDAMGTRNINMAMDGHIVLPQPVADPVKTEALREKCDHGISSLKSSINHFSELFEFAAQTMPNGCRYPGHYWVLKTDLQTLTGRFSKASELRKISDIL